MLPQEVVDLIIDQLEGYPAALKSCSLVSRQWAARSQKHLFARVVIRSDYLRRWCKRITPGSTGVSSYTTHLVLVAAANPLVEEPWFDPNLLRHASDHLCSFTDVHNLDVIRWKFSDEEDYTAPFAQIALSTRTLRVTSPVLDSLTFLPFIAFFYRAESISVTHPQVTIEEFVVPDLLPTPSTTFCWTSLRLLDLSDKSLPLLDWIARLPLRLINLSIGLQSQSYHNNSLISLLQASSETLQTLQLCRSAGGPLSAAVTPLPLSLPPLPQLRSVRFCALLGVGWLRAETLLSITSQYISRITIEMQHLLDPVILGRVIDWDAIDRALQVLEIRSQSYRTSKLVVQFYCLTHEWKEEVKKLKERTGWLPRFERAGVIEFVSDGDSCMSPQPKFGGP
ncbi:hypothetical protein BJ322DRAFT_1107700 [Thelephora terrestris]|uniref:F-box domain-containing protein n=1 Tax=Thelephora terrestris TaxID=56493 RepID=A0A9P6HGZ3_9AGAM|nr:hypothetical protein BJ322DRAFT_1107700 [Thelephora terrestris]